MRFLQVLLPIYFISTTVFAQWEIVSPSKPVNRVLLKALIPPGIDSYYAIGNDMAVSNDFGSNWQRLHQNIFPAQLTAVTRYFDVVFPGKDVGYLVYHNTIYKTTDQGGRWTKQLELSKSHPGFEASARFHSLHFVNDQVGYAVGDFQKIFKTVDGGENWERISWSAARAPFFSYTDVFFLDEQIGYVSGYEVADVQMNFGFDSFLLKTLDGGKTWERFPVPVPFDYRSLTIQFINESTGFLKASFSDIPEKLFMTLDGGETWTDNTPSALDEINCVHWVDGSIGIAAGISTSGAGAVYRTQDGGMTWTEIEMPGTEGRGIIRSINFLDALQGFAVGEGGYIATTSDGGITWSVANPNHRAFTAMKYISDDAAFAISEYGFFRSTDGGVSWELLNKEGMLMLSLAFKSENAGYLYGYRNFLYGVSEGGSKINEIDIPVNFGFEYYLLSEGDSLFVGGQTVHPIQANVLLKSGDRGATWQVTEINDGSDPFISLDKHGDIYFAATPRSILSSKDNGRTWSDIPLANGGYFQDVVFLNNTVGIASTTSGDLLRSSDGGVTWSVSNASLNGRVINGISVIDDSLIYAFGGKDHNNGRYGSIWRSVDNGVTWTEEQLPVLVDHWITAVTKGKEFIYATGGYGHVLRTKIPDNVVTGVEYPVLFYPEIRLYPVPCSKDLFIDTEDHPRYVTLYSITGSAETLPVNTLDDQYVVDMRRFSPGLYFVEIRYDEYVIRKKVIKE